ncbi:MAG: hypothetical protein IID45_11790 [Planctomycetes bacterium]|nr:hypothetical protein [Planctomycetota bacterium]
MPTLQSAQRKRHPFWKNANIGLALFLGVEFAGFAILNDELDMLELMWWVVVGTVLVFNTLRRSPPFESDKRWWVWLICSASTVRFLAFESSTATQDAYWILIGLNLLADTALIALGRSFSLLPARRAIRQSGPYRIVRHPAYSAYLIIDLVYIAQLPTVRNLAVFFCGVGLFVCRALLEERLLSNDPVYREYRKRTRWRFLPLVY